MTQADIPAGLSLCRTSNWNQLEDDWRVFLDLPGGKCFVAENDRGVVGTSALLRHGELAWVAMMLVDVHERRAGIGSQLLRRVLSESGDARGTGLDATATGERLYRRHGFVDGPSLVRMKSIARAHRLTVRNGGVRRMTAADLPHVFNRDCEIFGADRSALLTDLFRRDSQHAWISRDGYCFGRPGYLYHQAGPIIANTAGAAEDLIASWLAAHEGNPCAIDAPLHARDWLASLESAGFVAERPFLRMYHREGEKPELSPRVFAIAGPEFG